ncbi:HdeA/HdeB family chaperone [Methylocystis parvus]|uniref:HdeA/HdeB family chaperone n=1 Tax=Methylocystis parvus TaxID=134 RepID=UPI003C772A13
MNRKLIFAGLFAAFAFAAPADAQVTLEMADITCKDFGGYDAARQDFVSNWMRGYFMAAKNLTVIDSRYVKRNSQKIARYCKKLPNSKLMDAVQKNAR